MSNGASKSIGIIVNVASVGVVTLTLGIWVSSIAKEQQILANRLTVIESNQQKIAESINSKLKSDSSNELQVGKLQQIVTGLKNDHIRLESESESRSELISEKLSNELTVLEDSLRRGQDSLKAELLKLVRDELKKTADSTPVEPENSSIASEHEGVIESIKSLSKKTFLELYALPTERGRSKGFFITDSGEAFYVDRGNDAIISAWNSVHKDEYKVFIRDLLAKSYRHRKEDLEKAILAQIPVDIVAELKATNIGVSNEITLNSIDGTPTYNESHCRMKAIVSIGSVLKPVSVQLPYSNLPGVTKVTPPRSAAPSQSMATASTSLSLSDTQIIDAIRKVSDANSAITEAYVFPKNSAKDGVVYAFSSGASPRLFVIDSAKDLVLPLASSPFGGNSATNAYDDDYRLVFRDTVQDAIDNHRDKLFRFFLNRHSGTAADLEKQVLSGTAKAEVTDVKVVFPSNSQGFPQRVSATVTIQAGSLVKQINSSIDCTDLPNMRSISR
ncbi:hypothetical protein [Bremerella sp.]|uniref:hypothetical protein n=1 Tax=Bremerella sp. TaxID=2795602 RepID=UPI00391B9BCE